jgi:UDP-3-O-[3-hydroxymyristoyl] glucosamine N-acyltransferase
MYSSTTHVFSPGRALTAVAKLCCIDRAQCEAIFDQDRESVDVQIGEGALLGDGASIREGCRPGQNCLVARYVAINYETVIGDRTKIMDLTHVTGDCRVGLDVFISLTSRHDQ